MPPTPEPSPANPRLVLIPVFNDWTATLPLLDRLARALGPREGPWVVVLVDDGSTVEAPTSLVPHPGLAEIKLLRLRRNLGHQRAIAVGLAFVREHARPALVVVMDGDGEDDPADVPRLLDCLEEDGGGRVVFAERRRRTEGLGFQLGYRLYRLLHRLLTGVPVRVGNFSVVPASALERLVAVPDLWNHYAASVYCSRIPFTTVPIDRGRRYDGRSKMSPLALAVHGLSAIAVFRERVAVRLLAVAGLALAGSAGLLTLVVAVRFLAPGLAVPGWATTAAGLLTLALLQIVTSMLVFTFVVLGSREQVGFLPLRDYPHFVGDYRSLTDAGGSS